MPAKQLIVDHLYAPNLSLGIFYQLKFFQCIVPNRIEGLNKKPLISTQIQVIVIDQTAITGTNSVVTGYITQGRIQLYVIDPVVKS